MALPVRRNREQGGVAERWDPFREFEDLQGRMGDLIENAWSGGRPGDGLPWVPLVDIEETDDAWIVEAELPGVKRQDVNVEIHDSELVVSGDIKERERKGVLRRRTRKAGRFEYRVALPGGADLENVDASINDGVLTLRIPKPERQRPRRIEVTA